MLPSIGNETSSHDVHPVALHAIYNPFKSTQKLSQQRIRQKKEELLIYETPLFCFYIHLEAVWKKIFHSLNLELPSKG